MKTSIRKTLTQLKEKVADYFEPSPPGWDEFVKNTVKECKKLEDARIRNGVTDEQMRAMAEELFGEFIKQAKTNQSDPDSK